MKLRTVFFEQINKTDKLLARLLRNREVSSKIRNERGTIIVDNA